MSTGKTGAPARHSVGSLRATEALEARTGDAAEDARARPARVAAMDER